MPLPLTQTECVALRAAAEAVQSRLDEPSGAAWFDLMIRMRPSGATLSLPIFRASLAVAIAKLDRIDDAPFAFRDNHPQRGDPLPSILRTFRFTPDEFTVMTAAAEALRMSRSELVQLAVVAAGYRLRIFAGAPVIPPPRSRTWRDGPGRREESCTERTSLTFSAITYGVLHLITEHVGLSEGRVVAGATYRYVAELQKYPLSATGKVAKGGLSRPDYKALAAIRLPPWYLE